MLLAVAEREGDFEGVTEALPVMLAVTLAVGVTDAEVLGVPV